MRKRARSLTPPQIRNTISRRFRPTGGVSGGRGGCANYGEHYIIHANVTNLRNFCGGKTGKYDDGDNDYDGEQRLFRSFIEDHDAAVCRYF